MTTPLVDTSADLLSQCRQIWAATQAQQQADRHLAEVPDLVRLWDGEWLLHHIVACENEARWGWADLDTAEGRIEVDTTTEIAQWLLDMQARIDRDEGRNVHATVDYASGQRCGYRLKVARQEDRDDGTSVVVAEFLSDMEELRYRWIKPNSFLPDIFQMPRIFIMPGPVRWLSAATLFLDLWREHMPLLTFPDDPMSLQWLTNLDQSTWSMVVKPISWLEDVAAGTVWGCVTARWDNYLERMSLIWRDAEITPVLRRYLAGDPPPWPGAHLRHGTLVVSFEDTSGAWTGTSHGGDVFRGLLRTVIQPSEDLIDSTLAMVTGATIPAEYFEEGNWITRKELPYAIYLAGENTGIKDMAFCSYPGTAVQLSTGGHSMPGVNEGISAAIQALGDVIGDNVSFQGYGIGSIGGAIDTLLKPIYEDTVLAWLEVKLFFKAQKQGWSHYFEQFIDSPGKCYTLASVIVLRSGAWATRAYEALSFTVRDAHPFVVGKHFWVGHRIGATRRHDHSGRIYIERVARVTRVHSRDDFAKWEIEMGEQKFDDPAEAIYKEMETLTSAVRTLGVY